MKNQEIFNMKAMPIGPSQNGKAVVRPKMGSELFFLGCSVDQSPSIILKVPEAISISLNQFPDPIEAFSSSVSESIFKEMDDLMMPFMKSFSESP